MSEENPPNVASNTDETASSENVGVVRRKRFTGGPARGFLSSLAADERIFAADIAVDRAHVIMLIEQDIIDSATGKIILTALDSIETAGHDALSEGEDVHEAIETAVIDRVGPAGGKMHTARSRNDEVATCIRYQLRSDLLQTIDTTLGLREVLLEAGKVHTETLMPGYTHLQSAQPITVGHWLCSYAAGIERDTARLLDVYDRVNTSPLGAAAFAGTPFDIDRERTATLLGFDGILENTMDAVAGRDTLIETLSALAAHAITLSGVAEDLIIFANNGYIELADEYASTSSIMPQKVNPDTLELVRAVAGDITGELTGLLTTLKGLPRAYNRDLQRATPHVWSAIDDITETTAVVGGAIKTAQWNKKALEAAAGDGFSTATGIADALAMTGIPFRTAHEVLTIATDRADGETPTIEMLNHAAEDALGESLFTYVDRETIIDVLDPAMNVSARDSQGGPAATAVVTAIETYENNHATHVAEYKTRRNEIDSASTLLDQEVQQYV
ncbi:argininosuccinate lyase [Haloquadratum walsbyi]|jgi:argininosuccinate lyase (EC 4.3.2.1)|uniref:Argininosuccinate lyase n=1 Tax=Haloquadratum walsbyi J07HQW2 TaxID=1238425 RepID=U1NGF6_9EURY|nr:argininosuccinate lyase [Haloquadratum walsbyi]ERG95893.1 MAG: argininosuccinate lyase [Haloquadratum walsbyi J07HQW2]